MLCPKCGKESNNRRVCGVCHTPYPTASVEQTGPRRGRRTAGSTRASNQDRSGGVIAFLGRQSRAKLWAAVTVLVALTVVYYLRGRDRDIPAGVVMPSMISASMSLTEATNTLNEVNGTAKVEERGGTLTVRIPAAMWPDRRVGQLKLAQEYARADEIVQARKRVIRFLDADGNEFARSDPEKGVSLTR